MQARSQSSRIIPAHDGHRAFVRRLSADVFSRFGDYETLLPRLMGRPWVATFVAEEQGRPLGFAMLAFEPGRSGELDLSAIAVEPACQRAGIGRRLLSHVEAEARRRLPAARPLAIRLSVAEDNAPARRLFEAVGYRLVPGFEESYPAGQPSLSMRKLLRPGA